MERRVEALEQEVQILKNQIQATLLDIQEQLLTNTYPSLRTEDTPAPHVPPFVPASDTVPNRPRQSADMHTVHNDVPVVKKVTFDETEPMPAVNLPDALPINHPADQPDWVTLNRLEEWVASKVQEMGANRARKVIELYAQKGRFNEEVKEILLSLVELHASGLVHSTPYPQPTPQRPPAQPAKPTSKPQANGKSHSNGKRAAAPTPSRRSAQLPAVHALPDDDEAVEQNLVLRLIAGVQNVGVIRRNDRG